MDHKAGADLWIVKCYLDGLERGATLGEAEIDAATPLGSSETSPESATMS